MRTLALVLAAALLVAACGDEPAPEPDKPPVSTADPAEARLAALETMKGMLALAKAGKWEEYVTSYYGEQQKMDDADNQVGKVAERLQKVGQHLVPLLEACVDVEPTLSPDGFVATWPNGYKLYLKDGAWGFHL